MANFDEYYALEQEVCKLIDANQIAQAKELFIKINPGDEVVAAMTKMWSDAEFISYMDEQRQ